MSNYKIETKCIQSGYQPGNGEPRVLPIYQSTTFKYNSSEQMGRLFDLEESGYFYTRLQNPTNDAVAAKICDLEGGYAAMLTSSGQAANFYAIMNIAAAGDHIVCASALYGGTYNLYAHTIKKMGIDATFVDPDCTKEELEAAFQENTKAVFGEMIANPALVVLDIEKFAQAAHSHGVPLIVDNTFATPINCRPFEWGADIVTHSTTKYMDGHAICVGGAIVDSGNFDWEAYADKFPGLTTPDETYHGIVYTQKFGKGAYITKATAQLMRDLGSIQAPQNAFLLNLGLETLHLRVERHCDNAKKAAEYLKNHEKVAWVECPSLPGDKYYDLAQKYMPKGALRRYYFRPEGRKRGCRPYDGQLKDDRYRHPRCRCKKLCPSPGQPYPPSDERSGTSGGRSAAGSDSFQCGNREYRRYHRRSEAGAGRGIKNSEHLHTNKKVWRCFYGKYRGKQGADQRNRESGPWSG